MGPVAGERILLVEDDERIGSTLLRALDGSGYDARWVRTGSEAEPAVAEHRPDVVLLDQGLPDIDGLDVCRRLHGRDAGLAIVMTSSDAEDYHLHGYDLEQKADAGKTSTFEFTADQTGQFDLESHITEKTLLVLVVV